ncbi:MAG: aminopeptidase N [Gammaproteobacteria bacterium]|nr:aminopeptidase N [Gammaproteobacteria bacterium]
MKESQAKTIYLKDYTPPDYLIDETHLTFQLFETHTMVHSRLVMRKNPAAERHGGVLVLNGAELELDELVVDGKALDQAAYSVDGEELSVPGVPDDFILECVTKIKPQENTSLEGLYKSRVMFCTQCEAEGFRKITYYLDRPDVLSSFTTRIEADKALYPVLLSNGNNIGSGDLDNGRHWVAWEDPFKKPSYLFALVAGDLKPVDDTFTTCSGREVELRIFVEEKDLDKCDFALASLKKAMRWDEEVYGREYDLDIFMIVAVDDFNMGAMENKGLNIFNSSCVLAKPETSTDQAFQRIEAIVAHEYFHNWSGNRVTCRDWFQLSLKEGFTVYRDSEFSADVGSRAVKRVEDVSFLRTIQFAEDSGPLAHSVRPESYMEISNFYTVTIYEKGAEVVRMQANLLGPELFRKGTDLYFERFDGQAVTTEDFVSTMEEVSGINLGQFRRWYTQAGTPRLEVSGKFDAEASTFTLHVKQSCPPTPAQPEKEPFYIPLTVGLLSEEGESLPLTLAGESVGDEAVLHVSEAQQDFVFEKIRSQPVPALLRGFSAPVKLHYPYSRDELMLMMQHENDGFARWEAAQQLALLVLGDLQSGRNEVDERLVSAFTSVLSAALDDSQDKAMLANLLILPSEAYLAEIAEVVDVDAIHQARESLRRHLASALDEQFLAVYQHCSSDASYVFNADEVARRSLKNSVLNYLVALDKEAYWSLARAQYDSATNMTDSSAALRAVVNNPGADSQGLKQELLDHFYNTWQDETLVIDQWFAMQSAASIPDNLSRVKALMAHEAFDIRNPNKVRSVIGAFCHNNAVGFHQLDGSGYDFLAEQVIALNEINPQIASRLLTPLTRWKKYGEQRQQLMQAALRRVLELRGISKDVYEVVSKSLQ